MVSEGQGWGGKERPGLRPRLFKQIALSIAFERVGAGPVAVRGEDIGIVLILPQFQIRTAGKGADLRGRGVEDLHERLQRLRAKRHADDADEQGVLVFMR